MCSKKTWREPLSRYISAKSHAFKAWVSCLRVENFDLTPAHACGPISHAWLKNVSCCHLAWYNFQKYVNSWDPCKERKPSVKWIPSSQSLIFEVKSKWKLRLRQTLDVFGRLRTSSGSFRNDRVVFKNPSTPRIKISRLYLRKSWQVYLYSATNFLRSRVP